jgi:hypothetical protein
MILDLEGDDHHAPRQALAMVVHGLLLPAASLSWPGGRRRDHPGAVVI